ncbi:MAG: DUF4956 domain-containing protein [Erysipelotrichaceae bacterium]|nr:DUF4956 domain-containing protein [Erysipelotrichaceae bacterium]
MSELETLFSTSITDTLTISGIVIVIITALFLGVVISSIYMLTHKKESYDASFTITLVILPAIISIIIMLVGTSVARAFSLAGAFSLIRFRSAMGNTKDITYIFFTVSIGLAVGMGYLGYGIIFTIIMCLAMYLLDRIDYGKAKHEVMLLRIVIPENMNFQKAFDDIFDTYTASYTLNKVKTSDLGSLFTLTYQITMKDNTNTKMFIDQIRQRNGNLDVTLTLDNHNSAVYY